MGKGKKNKEGRNTIKERNRGTKAGIDIRNLMVVGYACMPVGM